MYLLTERSLPFFCNGICIGKDAYLCSLGQQINEGDNQYTHRKFPLVHVLVEGKVFLKDQYICYKCMQDIKHDEKKGEFKLYWSRMYHNFQITIYACLRVCTAFAMQLYLQGKIFVVQLHFWHIEALHESNSWVVTHHILT